MTVQDITLGYWKSTGEPVTLTQHEKTFIEFCDYKGVDAAAWKKADQIGYYRALQDDWETARDDDQDPPVVDRLEDLPDDIRARLEA